MFNKNLGHLAKMRIGGQKRRIMLHRQSSNPQIVAWNRSPHGAPMRANHRIAHGRLFTDWRHDDTWALQKGLKLETILFTPRSCLKPCPDFTEHDGRQENFSSSLEQMHNGCMTALERSIGRWRTSAASS